MAQTFRYIARAQDGTPRSGSLDARDRSHAIVKLKDQNLIVISLSREGEEAEPAAVEGKKKKPAAMGFGAKITGKDLAVFTREFAALVGGGISVPPALNGIAEEAENPALKKVLKQISHTLEGGIPLSDCLRAHPNVFPPVYYGLVEAGETSGKLDTVLNRLADYLETSEELRRKFAGSMVYPAGVVAFSMMLVAGLVFFVLPRFAAIYEGLDTKLPAPTAFLMGIGNFAAHNMIPIVLVAVGAFWGFQLMARTEAYQAFMDRIVLKIPVLNAVVKKLILTRFCLTFQMLYNSGVSILPSMDIVGKVAGNRVYKEAMTECRELVSSGDQLARAMRHSGLFPGLMLRLIETGEKSGTLGEMLGKLAEYYESELRSDLESLASLMEPLLIAWVGILIGGLVIVLFLPLVNLIKVLG